MPTVLNVNTLGHRISGVVGQCRQCERFFVGRSDAIYCCNTCRMRWQRIAHLSPEDRRREQARLTAQRYEREFRRLGLGL